MSKMDFSGFKKVAQDDHTATFRHEKLGHELKIAHKGLSPKLKTQLDALPIHQFAEGGMGDDPIPEPNPTPNPTPTGETGEGSGAEIAQSGPSLPEPVPAHNAGPGPANTMPESAQDPLGTMAATQGQIAGLGEQRKGQKQVAEAQGALGVAQASLEQAHQKEAANQLAQYETQRQGIVAKRTALQDDMAKGHFNPTHYIDNMGTGQKIRTGLGLILGGMGAGLTHGSNLSFQYLQNQIDRDIQGQRDEMGKKKNLLSQYVQEEGSLTAGMQMHRIHSNDILASKLRQEADKAQNPIAKGNMLDIAGKFDQQSAQLQHNLAIEKMQQAAFGGGGAGVPSAMVLETLPPEKRERAVQMPGGGLRLASTKEGAHQVREQLQTIQPIFNSLDKLQSLGAAALVPGSQAAQAAHAIRAQLIPLVNENAGLKRLSAEDIGNIKEMITDPTKFSSLMGSAKSNSFKNFLQDKLVSTMSQQLEGATAKRSMSGGHNFGFTPKKYSK